ncbi:MAG: FAD binding domain-containing protein [Chloroflexota bacterium]|nr:FAD binding domain-containing protein [Chloroflexota bacterium]
MLRLPEFDYYAPETLEGAVELLRDHGPEAMVVAGGTDLFPKMKRRQMEPRVLVGLRRIRELYGIREREGGGYLLGSMATLTQINETRRLRDYAALQDAAGSVSTPQLRNAGTIGGNLCVDTRCTYYDQTYHWRKSINFCLKKDGEICWVAPGSSRCWAVTSSDTAPVLIALDAQVRLVGPRGERTVPVGGLYGSEGIDYLAGKRPDEILTEILLPEVENVRSVYIKVRRRGSFDFPILGVGATLQVSDDGTIQDARLVLGAVESFPLVIEEARELLIGNRLDEDLIEAVAQAAFKAARPLDNTDLTLYYRKKVVPVHVRRALRQLAGAEEVERTA